MESTTREGMEGNVSTAISRDSLGYKTVSKVQSNLATAKGPCQLSCLNTSSGIYAPQCLGDLISQSFARNGEDLKGSISISKYPGTLHVVLDSLEKLGLGMNSQISLMCFVGESIVATQRYHGSSFVKVNQYLKIPIQSSLESPLTIRMVLQRHAESCSSNVLETTLVFTSGMLSAMHNRLEEVKATWKPYKSGRLLDFVSNFLSVSKSGDALLRVYCSFTADEEMSPEHSLESLSGLCKWIMVRKYACDCLFEGILNVKGENQTYTWKRRHVKWYGYTLYVFDVHTNRMVSQVALTDAIPSLDLVKNGILRFVMGDKELKMHCDTPESLIKCMEAAYIIFPKMLDWI